MVDHVVMGNNSFRCLNCGAEHMIIMPCGMQTFLGAGRGFEKDHAGCVPSDAGASRFRYETVREWWHSWDTGISSMTIYNHMFASALPEDTFPPVDPSDFGRCVRLLDVAESDGFHWRERMPEMASIPGWRVFVECWDELEDLYREESPRGRCPKLFARMQELNDA